MIDHAIEQLHGNRGQFVSINVYYKYIFVTLMNVGARVFYTILYSLVVIVRYKKFNPNCRCTQVAKLSRIQTSAVAVVGFLLLLNRLSNHLVYRYIVCYMTEGFITTYYLYYRSYHAICGYVRIPTRVFHHTK